jgi:tRNA A-37 threonylcarbamoyl transferase component Bud32
VAPEAREDDHRASAIDPSGPTEIDDFVRAVARIGVRPLAPGQILAGRYQLVGLLGAGAMGTVYKARDLELDELIAVKTLRRELVDAPLALEHFRDELKLARRVTHRAVARVFDLGEHGGERFLTMELIGGASLAHILRERGVLAPAEVIRLGGAIAEGLAAAHAAGVLHRDLKPDNVLVDGDRVAITDFGVACALAGDRGAAELAGTPAYMAPEQVECGALDGRADLYGLGVLLFEAISGQLPFAAGSAAALAHARLVQEPRDLLALAPGCPPALAAVIHRALARAPEDRFPSAEAMGTALAALALGGTAATPLPAVRPAPDPRAIELLLRSRREAGQGPGTRIDLLERALAFAPDDPIILSAFAFATAAVLVDAGARPDLAERVVAAAERALELAPHLAEPWVALALVRAYCDDDAGAVRAILQAKRIGPSVAEADDVLGRLLIGRDLHEEGRAHLERALWIKPDLYFAHVTLARTYLFEGRHDDARRELAAMRHNGGHHAIYAMSLALSGLEIGDLEPPADFGYRAFEIVYGALARTLRTRRVTAADARIIEELCAAAVGSRVCRMWRQIEAEMYGYAGDAERCAEAIARAVDAGLRDLNWMRRCPAIAPARSHPRFAVAEAAVAARAEVALAVLRAGAATERP